MSTTTKEKVKPVIRRDVEIINDPITGIGKLLPSNKQKNEKRNGGRK